MTGILIWIICLLSGALAIEIHARIALRNAMARNLAALGLTNEAINAERDARKAQSNDDQQNGV